MQAANQAAPSIYMSEQAAVEIRTRYQELLRLWPVPNMHPTVPTRQGDTFVVASGPEGAPPLVLLHGTMANAAAWMREVPTLAQEFRVYAVDIIGDAGLSAPSRPPFGTDAHAQWLSDVLDGLAAPRAALVGTSVIMRRFEEYVAQAEVVLYPEARHYLGDQSPAIAQFLRRVYA